MDANTGLKNRQPGAGNQRRELRTFRSILLCRKLDVTSRVICGNNTLRGVVREFPERKKIPICGHKLVADYGALFDGFDATEDLDRNGTAWAEERKTYWKISAKANVIGPVSASKTSTAAAVPA